MRCLLLSMVVLFSALLSALPGYGTDVSALASAVDARYDHLRSLQADFSEIYTGAGMARTESGTLWLKKPGKMRWEYRSPRQKLFISDGKEAWFYLPAERQVRKTPVRQLDDLRSPLAFLLGKTHLEKELQGLSEATDAQPITAGDVILRGVPQAMADRVNQVLLEITPDHWICRIVLEEGDGATTEYRFGDQKPDLAIADQQFRFTIPEGVEVIDENFGQ